ncbi:MAG: hypothetical protein BGO31_13100 [Bacteroidetes bacterium 43-16]|nr:MAG: hypothetical protein BGO31_13100 [Bacteroidetes bacterium 43-16]
MHLVFKPYSEIRDLSTGHLIITLTAADFENVQFKDGDTVLPFVNCFFEKLTIINREEIPFGNISIAFFNCLLPEIEVKTIQSQNITLGFYHSFVSGKIESSNLRSIDLNNCLTPSELFLIGAPSVQIKFTKENFDGDRWQGLFIQYYIQESYRLLEKEIKFNIYDPKNLHISSNFLYQEEFFKPEVFLSYKAGEDHITTIVKGVSLNALSISGNPAGVVAFENAKIKSLYIYDFYPTGDASLFSIAPVSLSDEENKIGIHNSKLDGVEFDNVSFDSYALISFYRTKFSKAVFTSCNFPEDYETFSKFVPIENVHYPDKKSDNYAKAQYEIFLQLKKALEDRGNYYEAQKLQAISHEALRQIENVPFFDKAILRINNLSNNHGLSIKRPLIGFFVISIPLYVLYLFSINRIFNAENFDPSLIGYYFSFIDITHRVDFLVEKGQFAWWTLIIDYTAKIMVGFFIYQFISAFRKYGKR